MKVADLPRPLSATWKAAAGVQMLRPVNELSKEPPGPAHCRDAKTIVVCLATINRSNVLI
jgi:hypothetical protein